MARSELYNTKQKDLILNVIKNQKNEFTIKDIYEELDEIVGLTTIYRLVDKLIDEKVLNRFISRHNITYYQYLKECSEENHFFLKCNKCGELIHIDCDCIDDLSSHNFRKHKFVLNKENIIINGVCEKCIKKGK